MKKTLVGLAAVLMFSQAWFCHAAKEFATFGEWQMSMLESGDIVAITLNKSEDALAQHCNPNADSCMWVLVTSTFCEKGAESPALLNTPIGGKSVWLLCEGPLNDNEHKYKLLIAAYEEMNDFVSRGEGMLGIAYGLDSGLFHVNRFSLNGGDKVIQTIKAIATARQKKAGSFSF